MMTHCGQTVYPVMQSCRHSAIGTRAMIGAVLCHHHLDFPCPVSMVISDEEARASDGQAGRMGEGFHGRLAPNGHPIFPAVACLPTRVCQSATLVTVLIGVVQVRVAMADIHQ